MSNKNRNTMEEYIAPAKSAAEIKADRAAKAAAKAKAEAEEAARKEAELRAQREAEEAALRAAEEQLKHKKDVENALAHFDEETQEDLLAERRRARAEARKRVEAELQAEAQALSMTERDRRKLEKAAAKGDEVARSQLLAAEAVKKQARERLAELDKEDGVELYEQYIAPPKKKKKLGRTILAIVLALIIIAGTVLGIFVYRKLNMIGSNVDEYTGVEEILENDIDATAIDSITDANSLTALMKAWYLNGGEPMQSKNVTNILLIGIDSDSKLSDSMMVLSVNRLAKTLSLVSFYRDSYTYMETATGANAFAKMNAAYYYGGAEMVQDVIEKDYKIKIDDYALVGYDSFPALVDALGGVDVKVTKKEANYLNKTWKKWTRTGNKIQFKAGTMHMDGEHALMFARIRKLDSDINRTERQRRVVTAIMDQFKAASLSEVNAAMNAILPEIKTSMKKSQMLNLATDAVTGGWLKYPMTQAVMPPVEYCEEGYAGDQWIWICDYEGAAFELQNMLYGQSNITLAEDRKNALDFSNGKTMTTTRGQYAGNYTYTTRPAQNYNSGGSGGSGGGSYNTTAYQTTQATTQGGGGWWQTTTRASGDTTTGSGGANPWWWQQTSTAAPTQAPSPDAGQ